MTLSLYKQGFLTNYMCVKNMCKMGMTLKLYLVCMCIIIEPLYFVDVL